MPSVSEAQHNAMEAAAHGRSRLGIPKKVAEEFLAHDSDGTPIAAGIVYVAPDGEVLLLRRASTATNFAGHWALPGGKAEDGETAEDAAIRESIEEMGLDPDDGALKVLNKTMTPNGMLFTTFARPIEKKFVPTLNDEHSGYAWASPDMLPAPLHPSVESSLGEHLGVTNDMTPDNWSELRQNFAKWTRDEEKEPAHAQDERLAFDRKSVRTYDKSGRLHVDMTNISKTNVCEYWGREIPLYKELKLDPDRKYRLLRDPAELAKAAPTFNNIQVLIKHIPVNADDHQPDKVVGTTGTDAVFEDPYLRNSMAIWVRDAIDGIENESKKELSSSYNYRADMTPGTFKGDAYDGVMRDIVGNHVALVKEGRAGADVVVGDSKENLNMPTKTVLSRKATATRGALVAYMMAKSAPQVAMDAALTNVSPLLAKLSAKNFKTEKSGLLSSLRASLKGKLANDASIDDLTLLLDKLEEEEVPEGADADPNSGLPMNKEEMEKRAQDADPEKAFLKSKLLAEDWAAYDKMCADRKARDESPEEKKKAEEKEAADKAAKDAAEKEAKDKAARDADPKMKPVTAAAMDEAIASARKQAVADTIKLQRSIFDAQNQVRPYLGELSADLAFDSAEAVYETALKALKVNIEGVHPSAFKAILSAQPLPGKKNGGQSPALAMDAAASSGFYEMFPDAKRIGDVG